MAKESTLSASPKASKHLPIYTPEGCYPFYEHIHGMFQTILYITGLIQKASLKSDHIYTNDSAEKPRINAALGYTAYKKLVVLFHQRRIRIHQRASPPQDKGF